MHRRHSFRVVPGVPQGHLELKNETPFLKTAFPSMKLSREDVCRRDDLTIFRCRD
jgi:hypothetical protein